MHIEKGLSVGYFQDIFLNVIFSCTLYINKDSHRVGLGMVMIHHCFLYILILLRTCGQHSKSREQSQSVCMQNLYCNILIYFRPWD